MLNSGKLTFSWVLISLLAGSGAAFATDEFETPPVFKASEILAGVPETLAGDNFKVREEVRNDGYWDFYTIDTPFGTFYAHGWFDLRQTIGEIEAIAQLQELSRTRVFADAVLEKGLQPLDVASQIIQHPVQTAISMPQGIVEMFQRYARRAREIIELAGKLAGGEDVSEPEDPRLNEACEQGLDPWPGACDKEGYADDFARLARHYFDVDDVSREFHQELGTDPYSSNEVLQDAIRRVAWVGGIGEYGIRKINPLGRVKAVGLAGQIYRLAWNKDPFELRKYLDGILIENGISDEQRHYFLNNPFLTPSKQAFIVTALENLDGVEGREYILDWAADSRNEDEAFYAQVTVALVAWYHGQHQAVRFIPNSLMPAIEDAEGAVVSLQPIDHLSWTEEVATILQAAQLIESFPPDKPRVLWLLNRASDRARREIEALGYQLVEDGYKEVLATGDKLELEQPALDSGLDSSLDSG